MGKKNFETVSELLSQSKRRSFRTNKIDRQFEFRALLEFARRYAYLTDYHTAYCIGIYLLQEKIVNSIPSVFVSSITRLQICEKPAGLFFCQASKSGPMSGLRMHNGST